MADVIASHLPSRRVRIGPPGSTAPSPETASARPDQGCRRKGSPCSGAEAASGKSESGKGNKGGPFFLFFGDDHPRARFSLIRFSGFSFFRSRISQASHLEELTAACAALTVEEEQRPVLVKAYRVGDYVAGWKAERLLGRVDTQSPFNVFAADDIGGLPADEVRHSRARGSCGNFRSRIDHQYSKLSSTPRRRFGTWPSAARARSAECRRTWLRARPVGRRALLARCRRLTALASLPAAPPQLRLRPSCRALQPV